MDFPINRCDICCKYFSKSAFFMYNHVKWASCLREPFNCEESILEPYHCVICQLKFDTITFLKNHITQKHRGEKEVENSPEFYKSNICLNCSFVSHSYLIWFKHFNDCSVPTKNNPDGQVKNWFECEKCTFKTSYKFALSRHFNTFHATDEVKKWFKCGKCAFKTTEKINLKRHIYAKHTLDEQKNWFICGKCTFKTTTRRCLKRHFYRRHTSGVQKAKCTKNEDKWFECDECTYKTPYNAVLKKHFGAKHADNKKLFTCEKCMYNTPYKHALERHFNNRHGNNKGQFHQCEKCTYKATTKDSLKIHMNGKHADDVDKKWFQCEKCTYKTPYKSALNRHFNGMHANGHEEISQHSDNLKDQIKPGYEDMKWFQCEKCMYKSIYKSNLSAHVIAKHQDKK